MSLPNSVTAAPDDPEPELVARARRGDREAFAALYHQHYRLVYGFLLVRTRNRHLAEDLTQEAFTRALRRIDSFTWQGTAFAAWLTTIAKNLHLDELDRGRTRRETPVAEFDDPREAGRDAETLALRALEAVEAHEAVRTALHMLNAQQRHCVELRFLDELTPQETALAMGRSVGAVKTLTYRALRKLRRPAGAVSV
ncbi:sigma-70 family RNA polymerase sigma factor [Streptomyces sp. uw30]|uniref:RNA polymerase sigma factor n=1 Tax=Streptomyces sp. uw30 TaxID=1828179 RepID=UPI0011CE0B36|nr:sigma-70 family RNA polymerase sigma factor [Streptomyces sp. uw30]TXS54143.1 sigma-70 family RNA polymerase sigma factor [Streptomyces sp. uw30]